jgi:hypothetical protein
MSDDEIRNKLEIKTTPDYTTKGSSAIVFMAYAKGTLPKITFSYPGYESRMVDLALGNVDRDFSERKINLGTIKLIKQDQDYNPELFKTDSIQSLPVPFGGPPTK